MSVLFDLQFYAEFISVRENDSCDHTLVFDAFPASPHEFSVKFERKNGKISSASSSQSIETPSLKSQFRLLKSNENSKKSRIVFANLEDGIEVSFEIVVDEVVFSRLIEWSSKSGYRMQSILWIESEYFSYPEPCGPAIEFHVQSDNIVHYLPIYGCDFHLLAAKAV